MPVQNNAFNEQVFAQKRGLEALPGLCPSAATSRQGAFTARNKDDYP
jgi:hypothetical protein